MNRFWAIVAVVLLAFIVPDRSGYAQTPSAAKGKAVAIVYDDSGSMKNTVDNRAAFANYATQLLLATLDDKDFLIFRPMNSGGKIQNVKGAIEYLRNNGPTDKKTPYKPIKDSISDLAKIDAPLHKWVLTITDGQDGEPWATTSKNHPDYEYYKTRYGSFDVIGDCTQAAAARIGSINVLIGKASESEKLDKESLGIGGCVSQDFYDRNNKDSIDISKAIFSAAETLNGFISGGLKQVPDEKNRTISVSSPWALRRLVVIVQDRAGRSLTKIRVAGKDEIRQDLSHPIVPIVRGQDGIKGLPKEAYVYRMQPKSGTIAANEKIVLHFDDALPPEKLIRVYAELAADFDFFIKDDLGREVLRPDLKTGKYEVCSDTGFQVHTALTMGGADLFQARTKSVVEIKNLKIALREDNVEQKLPAGEFTKIYGPMPAGKGKIVVAEIRGDGIDQITPPKTIAFVECKRQLTIKSGDSNPWSWSVDRLADAPYKEIHVSQNGEPLSKDKLANFNLSFGNPGTVLEQRVEDGKLLIRPEANCCLWWWKNPGPGKYSVSTTITPRDSTKKYDIQGKADLNFVIEPPQSLLDKIRWYGCPFFVLAGLGSLLWYFLRLIQKHRLGPDARFEIEEDPGNGGTKRRRTVFLREEGNKLARWLWPCRAEEVRVRNVRFRAEREDLVVDGRDLEVKHKIPGWVFDRSRVNAPSKKERIQDNASLSDGQVMTVNEGAFVARIRYRFS